MRAPHGRQQRDGDVAENQNHAARTRGRAMRLAVCPSLMLAAVMLAGVGPVRAQECAEPVGTVQSLEGEVSIGDAGGAWRPAQLGAPLCQTESVRTGSLSRAALMLRNDEVLRLDQETTLRRPTCRSIRPSPPCSTWPSVPSSRSAGRRRRSTSTPRS